MPDIAKVKRNVSKMVSMNAPESDIDEYIASEGTTVDDVRNFKTTVDGVEKQNILGAIGNVPGASNRAAIGAQPALGLVAPLAGSIAATGIAGKEAQQAASRGAAQPSSVPTFQKQALDKYYGSDEKPSALKVAGGMGVSALGLAQDIATDPITALTSAIPFSKPAQMAGKAIAGSKIGQGIEKVMTADIGKSVTKALTPNYTAEINKVVDEGINRGIRPSFSGKVKQSQQKTFKANSVKGVVDIVENKGKFQYKDADGNIRENVLPENVNDFGEVGQQRMKDSYELYTKAANDAGQTGADVNLLKVVSNLRKRLNSPDIRGVVKNGKTRGGDPALYSYLDREVGNLLNKATAGRGKVTPLEAQDIIQKWNAELKRAFKASEFNADTKAGILGEARSLLRKMTDDVITKASGVKYNKARELYAAHRSLADDIGKRILVNNRSSKYNAFDIVDAISSGEFIYGAGKVLTGNPSGFIDILKGAAMGGAKGYMKARNNPDNIIKEMFQKVDKLHTGAKQNAVKAVSAKKAVETSKTLGMKQYPTNVGAQSTKSWTKGELVEKAKQSVKERMRQKGQAIFPSGEVKSKPQDFKTAEEYVASKGSPVYHGTNEEFESFELGRTTGAQGRTSKQGVWFTNSKEEAVQYAKLAGKRNYQNQEQYEKRIESLISKSEKAADRGDYAKQEQLLAEAESLEIEMKSIEPKEIVKEAILPKNMLKHDSVTLFNSDEMDNVIARAKKEGYDGVAFSNISDSPFGMKEPTNQYVVFDPSQIKTKSQLTTEWQAAQKSSKSLIEKAKQSAMKKAKKP